MDLYARIPRRLLLRGAAAGGAAGTLLAGCVRGAGGGSTPAAASPATVIQLAPWNWSASRTLQDLMAQVLQGFEQLHPGTRVQVVPGNGCCNPTGDATSLVTGTAADVFTDNDVSAFRGTSLLTPLRPLLERDNVDTSIWPKQEFAALNWAGGVFALPVYYNIQVYVVNLGAFDEAGVAYPSPTWDHLEFAQAAQAVTATKGGTTRYGCKLDWGMIGPNPTIDWVLRGFGGATVDASGTRCLMGGQGAVAAGTWVYEDLYWPKVATTSGSWGGGQVVMVNDAPSGLVGLAEEVAKGGVKWDFWPNPTFPKGPAASGPAQLYMINPATKQPSLAWDLLKWLCVEPTWQRAMMRMFLVPPGVNSLWEEWQTVVQGVAPPFKGKNLKVFTDAAMGGFAYPYPGFRYADVQAKAMIGSTLGALGARRGPGVAAAFSTVAAQIDALEKASAAEASKRATLGKAFPTTGPVAATVPTGV